jgi:hypothetical protein
MVGLIAVGVWEQFSSTDEKVALEASALAALYRDVSAYPEPDRSVLRADLREFTQNVIHVSWPLQRKGLMPWQTNELLWKFASHLMSFQPANSSQVVLHEETFRATTTWWSFVACVCTPPKAGCRRSSGSSLVWAPC